MRRRLLLTCALLFPGLAAAETQLVKLKNGTEIYGTVAHRGDMVEVTSVSGQLQRFKLSDIAAIESLGGRAAQRPVVEARPSRGTSATPAGGTDGLSLLGGAPAGSASDFAAGVNAIQHRILSDPEMMEVLMQIAEDPAILSALLTPGVLQAVRTGDLQSVSKDPGVARAAADPRIQKIVKKLAAELEAESAGRGRR